MAGTVLPLLLAGWFASALGSDSAGWSLMAAVLAASCIVPTLVTWRVTRGLERFHERSSSSVRELWRSAFSNRSLLYALAAFCGVYAALNVQSAVAVYFMISRLGFSEELSSLAFLLNLTVALVAVPIVSVVARRAGKPRTLGYLMLVWAMLAACYLFVSKDNSWLFWILTGATGVPLTAGVMLTWAMIPDCTEIDEFRTGERREGLYYGLVTFAQQGVVAVLLWVVGVALSLSGYVATAAQSPSAMWTIRLLMSGGTAVCAVLAAWMAFRQPMTSSKHAALRRAVEAKQAGETYEVDAFADLL